VKVRFPTASALRYTRLGRRGNGFPCDLRVVFNLCGLCD